ncbi:quercetin 2,3-dioxygenase [Nocardia macrotermitis]|uniref:Quercetin 2,3-dioxygenase n=1 Tax=Nocardia macrotermitis TaxID=2585198 RepID=A0A7K0DEV7_9NOCA|nr:quercetin 2,3-dioxygenase [Nocardia macrotermitis]MQY24179.1 Quercetin 2,3-dioxygenase [Nocardia macrotermitis]
MTVIDLEAMHRTRPLLNALPGEPAPYYLASGEGQRYEIDGQLWTVIARPADTGGLFDAAFILGPRGAGAPFHSLAAHQRTYYVFDGSVQFWLPGRSHVLAQGDSIHVPPGVPVAYRILGHGSRMLFFSAPGGALDVLLDDDALAQARVEAHMYTERAQAAEQLLLPRGARRHTDEPFAAATDDWDDALPDGVEPYFLRALSGERLDWPDAIQSFDVRGRNTGGRYFSVLSAAAPQPYFIRHFHQHHTENFFCMSGRIWLYANGEEVLLTPGDFVHAPAGTIHTFAIEQHGTRLLGMLTSDIFEPFFEVTGDRTDLHTYTEGLLSPELFQQRLAANAANLDVVVVGPPPTRTRALDL